MPVTVSEYVPLKIAKVDSPTTMQAQMMSEDQRRAFFAINQFRVVVGLSPLTYWTGGDGGGGSPSAAASMSLSSLGFKVMALPWSSPWLLGVHELRLRPPLRGADAVGAADAIPTAGRVPCPLFWGSAKLCVVCVFLEVAVGDAVIFVALL
jgi:hypothetical protein